MPCSELILSPCLMWNLYRFGSVGHHTANINGIKRQSIPSNLDGNLKKTCLHFQCILCFEPVLPLFVTKRNWLDFMWLSHNFRMRPCKTSFIVEFKNFALLKTLRHDINLIQTWIYFLIWWFTIFRHLSSTSKGWDIFLCKHLRIAIKIQMKGLACQKKRGEREHSS